MSDATRVNISYPADLSGWGRDQLDTPWFRAYLKKTLGEPAVGDVFEEFVDVGCCGSSLDVPLRIEAIDGGTRVGETTTIEYTEREACGIEGGWLVQSEGAPQGR
ncbi:MULTISPECIES: hypothetical protein [unclassified Haladaptatus]|uniref:hypothetical protein n=1 Tax=unclassified Haladaptatus TaxID=2622732 RepID=UPI0023E774C5|nr:MULTISPECIES: hypothetical protein [unclassified Haladaptatus]